MPSSRHDAAAAERKRLRDRVAQQNLRLKRNRYVESLEEQVKKCREEHRPQHQDGEVMRRTIQELRAENASLRERQHRLQALFNSCEEVIRQPEIAASEDTSCNPSSQALDNPIAMVAGPSDPRLSPPACFDHMQTAAPSTSADSHQLLYEPTTNSPGSLRHPIWAQGGTAEVRAASRHPIRSTLDPLLDCRIMEVEDLSSTDTDNATLGQGFPSLDLGFWDLLQPWGTDKAALDLPVWARVPLRNLSLSYHLRHCPWDAQIQAVLDAPEDPSPLELLFGSQHNALANLVQSNVKKWYHGDPERLAIGWLAYRHIKWRTQPTLERYLRLPDCLKPASEQTWLPHPGCLDLIFWKKLRLNLLKNYGKYDMDAFMRLYCRCLRLRWSSDDEVLVPDGDDRHVVRPDFLERFMSEEGWGLKDEFITEYPELFEGLDLQKVVYHVA